MGLLTRGAPDRGPRAGTAHGAGPARGGDPGRAAPRAARGQTVIGPLCLITFWAVVEPSNLLAGEV
jgi:hypothetical protein